MYQAAIFFDNEIQNVSNVKSICGPITSVCVDETPNLKVIPWDKLTEFTSRIGKNKYADLLQSMYKGETYDERSGINASAITAYLEWEHSTHHLRNRACLLDWDRTITKVEGLTLPSRIHMNQLIYDVHKSEYSVPIEDFLVYLCGSAERYMMMKLFFRSCVQDNVDIIVLTNNGAAADLALLPIFQTIVDTFTGVPTKIIAASTFDYHKGIALQKNVEFEELCKITRSGGKLSNRRTRKFRKSRA